MLVLLLACSSSDGSGSQAPATRSSAPSAGTSGAIGTAPASSASNTAGVEPTSPAAPEASTSGSNTSGSTNDGAASNAPVAADSAPDVAASNSGFVSFSDPNSDFKTEDVRDADRQIMHFDAAQQALVWADNGDRVTGWTAQANDLAWSDSSIQFRVRFGTEAGEQRAYFTEAGSGTICNLDVSGPDALYISATDELPPNG